LDRLEVSRQAEVASERDLCDDSEQ
jgi:hypothetical protein